MTEWERRKSRRKLGITLEAEFRAGDGVGAESEGSPGAIPKSVTSECTVKVKDMKLGFVSEDTGGVLGKCSRKGDMMGYEVVRGRVLLEFQISRSCGCHGLKIST